MVGWGRKMSVKVVRIPALAQPPHPNIVLDQLRLHLSNLVVAYVHLPSQSITPTNLPVETVHQPNNICTLLELPQRVIPLPQQLSVLGLGSLELRRQP
jgi:hypothetical protein